ncbi:MAG: tail fiber protein [Bacteroidia bacterium]
MRKTIILLALAITSGIAAFAQTFPYGINYQAVARDANGNAESNASVPLRFTIYQTSPSGTVVYQETQSSITTNSMGQFNAVIGAGQPVNPFTTASFSQINWTNANYYLKVEIQTGITTFVQIGATTQFQSVPYALAAPDPTPPGAILAYGGVSAPQGYLICHGQAVSRTGIYANLFAAIGTAYGNGDGSTTFNVPDFRGMFLRGADSTAINDPDAASRTAVNGGNSGAKVGSYEADAFKSHSHTMAMSVINSGSSAGYNYVNPLGNNTMNSGSTGGNETRPKNVYVNYIIRY